MCNIWLFYYLKYVCNYDIIYIVKDKEKSIKPERRFIMNKDCMTYVMEIMNESMIINSMIKDRTVDPVVFVDYSGHVSGLRVDLFALGWNNDEKEATRRWYLYLDDDFYIDMLQECVKVLQSIRQNLVKKSA